MDTRIYVRKGLDKKLVRICNVESPSVENGCTVRPLFHPHDVRGDMMPELVARRSGNDATVSYEGREFLLMAQLRASDVLIVAVPEDVIEPQAITLQDILSEQENPNSLEEDGWLGLSEEIPMEISGE